MQLLVSVDTVEDALEALAGGADIIDAKNPGSGALGAVSLGRFADIRAVVGHERPLTAALGEVASEREAEDLAAAFAEAGATLVKTAPSALRPDDALAILRAAVRGAARAGDGVVAVAYADAEVESAVRIDTVVALAREAGARGVLLDTANKGGPALTQLVDAERLTAFIDGAHRAGLTAALAGRVVATDLPLLSMGGADIAGVRGAACESGRLGRVSRRLVAALAAHARGPYMSLSQRDSRNVFCK
jgi:hypothetical protein